MGLIASALVPGGRLALGYSEVLLKDVQAADFARFPKGIHTNHPAFVYGHLAVYPDRVLEMIGRPDLAAPDQAYVDLFSAGKECVDDASGTIYPAMEAIVARFKSRHETALAALAETTDEVLARVNPNEKMRDRFPTLGAMATFLFSGHMMIHLGQVSAWRRIMGLGSAM